MPHYTQPRRSDQLDYVQSMLTQLRAMAATDGHDMLAYLIEMACLEAAEVLRGPQTLGIRQDKGNRPT
jgi:hypothetical protein